MNRSIRETYSSESDSPVDHRSHGQFPGPVADIAEEKLNTSTFSNTPDSSIDVLTLAALHRGDKPQEVDFYKNPTVLSRLCLNQKYDAAMRRLSKTPDEAAIWVCCKRKLVTSSKQHYHNYPERPYSVRQLPLHICCSNLRRTHDAKLRLLLNQLITNLIVTNSDACSHPDHEGQKPFPMAIWNGAYPETISVFLTARPELLSMKDAKGRSMIELNEIRSGDKKRQVREILQLGVNFWQHAHDDNAGRFREAAKILADKNKPLDDPAAPPRSKGEIEALSWEQLEERAMALEQILSEMNEKNYELNLRISDLQQQKEALLDQIDELQRNDLTNELERVQAENVTLNEQLAMMEETLRHYRKSNVSDTDSSIPAADPLVGSPKVALMVENRVLRKNFDQLNDSYREQRHSIRNLENMVRRLLPQSRSSTPKTKSSQARSGADSETDETLSTHSSLRFAEEQAYDARALNRTPGMRSSASWQPPNFSDLKKVDDLDAIFKEAAESQAVHRTSISSTIVSTTTTYASVAGRVETEERKESVKSLPISTAADADSSHNEFELVKAAVDRDA